MNIIIITGASSGMGLEFALQLDKIFDNIDEIWLIARRKKEMIDAAQNMKNNTRVLDMDLTNSAHIDKFERLLEDKNPVIRMLVNCAGYGIMGDFSKGGRVQHLGMIDLNCRALTEMTHICIPYMKKNSRIIQLASSAAFLPQPDFAVYAASKSYVYSFSRALARELAPRDIYVTAVCPGPVDTPFFDAHGRPNEICRQVGGRPAQRAGKIYLPCSITAERTGSTLAIKKLVMADAEKVVRLAIADSFKKKERSVYGMAMKGFEMIAKAVPHSVILKLIRFAK